MNCEWGNWGSWHSSNGNENEDRCACDKSKIEVLEIESPPVILSNISMIIFNRIQIIECFSDSQNRSRFVQIEQIRSRYVKSYAAGGETCNKKDGKEERLCNPCESGIKSSSLYHALTFLKLPELEYI